MKSRINAKEAEYIRKKSGSCVFYYGEKNIDSVLDIVEDYNKEKFKEGYRYHGRKDLG